MDILRKLRESAGMTLRDVETATSISNAYLSQLETGKIRRPSAQAIYTLAKLYSYDMEKLFIETGLFKEIKIEPAEMKVSAETRLDDLEKRVKKLENANVMSITLI